MGVSVKRKKKIKLLIILILFVVASIFIINAFTIKGEVLIVDNKTLYIIVDSGLSSSSAYIYWKDTNRFKAGDNIIIVYFPYLKILTSDPPYVSGAKLIFKSPFK